jgi:hypothetical protein
MAFKVVVADKIVAKIKGSYVDASGQDVPFEFQLVMDRLSEDDMNKALRDQTETAAEFLKKHTDGWREQRLVLGDDGQPAPFGAEAFAALLSINGMPGLCFAQYRMQSAVHAKN